MLLLSHVCLSVVSDSVQPHRRKPTRLPCPWDSPGKNTGVGCHYLLQCVKVKSEREVAQSCPTLRDPMDCSLSGSSVHGIFQARVLEWDAITFSKYFLAHSKVSAVINILYCGSDHELLIAKFRLKLKKVGKTTRPCGSVQFSGSVVSNYLQPDKLQHARPPCPSQTPGVHPDSCPSSQ